MSNKLGDRNARRDVFHKKAKQAGFAARAVFKLEEIDKRYRLFKAGARVLDLGCRPGSWLQYVHKQSPNAKLVGLDREPLDVTIPNATIHVGDVYTIDLRELVGDLGAFDVVLSDMAPDTSGVRSQDQARSEALFERALEIAEHTLAPGGHFLGKLFQGPDWQKLTSRVRAGFAEMKTLKPDSSRKESIEQYVLGMRKKPG
jgi:23S rRNA (uridine2552-2'-O)-methyltransferase